MMPMKMNSGIKHPRQPISEAANISLEIVEGEELRDLLLEVLVRLLDIE